MPYKNIVFVKFRLELLSDIRFTDKLDDNGKLIYMGLLLLAGRTNNQIPNDPIFIKRNLNLLLSEDEISQKITEIKGIFPKLIGSSQFLKFKNFNTIHNFIGSNLGNPKDLQEEKRIDKKRIDSIRYHFCNKYNEKVGGTYIWNYGKDGSIVKNLLLILKDEEVVNLIDEFFKTTDPFPKTAGYTVGVFKSIINKLRVPKKVDRGDI